MNNMQFTRGLILLVTLFASPLFGAPPATTQTSVQDSPDAKRLTFLGDQLSADEAAINMINKTLVQAGYKAAIASDRASLAARGNDLMNRQGGGPVAWKDFYGRTARDFVMHDRYSTYYQLRRPSQFSYVYRANNNQIEAAKAEIDSMGRKVDELLARRQQLEAEQSALWATIAFESITNRDISLRPLYRNQLHAEHSDDPDKRGAKSTGEPPTVTVLRAAVLYVRTAEAAARNLDKNLDTDQGACYAAMRNALAASFASFQDSAANFNDVNADPAKAKQLADVVASAKSVLSLCTDLNEAYRKAKDAEKAKEESRRQLYRATMQESLFGLAETVGHMDEQLEALSDAWGVQPERGVRSTDKVPEISLASATTNAVASTTSAAPVSPTPSRSAGTKVDLMPLADVSQTHGHWRAEGSTFVGSADNAVLLRFRYHPPTEYDLHLVLVRQNGHEGSNFWMPLPQDKEVHFYIHAMDEKNYTECGFQTSTARGSAERHHILNQAAIPNQRLDIVLKVRKGSLEAIVDDKSVSAIKTDFSDMGADRSKDPDHPIRIGVFKVKGGSLILQSAAVIEVSGPGKVLK
jgi:hypothetical protein